MLNFLILFLKLSQSSLSLQTFAKVPEIWRKTALKTTFFGPFWMRKVRLRGRERRGEVRRQRAAAGGRGEEGGDRDGPLLREVADLRAVDKASV